MQAEGLPAGALRMWKIKGYLIVVSTFCTYSPATLWGMLRKPNHKERQHIISVWFSALRAEKPNTNNNQVPPQKGNSQ